MEILFLFLAVFAAGFLGLLSLIVIETELCPHWLRRILKRHAKPPPTAEDEQAKSKVRKGHARRLKGLEA